MHKIISTAIIIVLIACNSDKEQPLMIAAASNVQFAAAKLIEEFEKESDIRCQLVLGSSGKLTAQIMSGAPFDIFLSADQKYPQYLYDEGLGISKPMRYASGRLILWSAKYNLEQVKLDDARFTKFAIANPKIAPYGSKAMEVLDKLGQNEASKDRLVYGENVAQVNQFIQLEAADAGLTSQSIAFKPDGPVKDGHWLFIPDDLYSPVAQDVIILTGGKSDLTNKQQFLSFLLSEKGKDVLKSFGYQ